MPAILAALGGVLINVASSIVGRVMLALGMGAVTYSGLSVTFDWLKDRMTDSLYGIPENILNLFAVMQIGTCLNIIISAVTTKLVMKGLTGGSIKKWVFKK